MQTHWLFINVNIDDIACYACRIVASPNVVFQGSKASKRTAFYSHFLFKEAFTWWNCNKRKEVRYDRSIFYLNSYKLYRNDDRMFKTQVQRGFTSFIRSITVWASRSLSGMVFSIYDRSRCCHYEELSFFVFFIIIFFLYFVDLMIKHLRTLSTGVATPLIKRRFKSTW